MEDSESEKEDEIKGDKGKQKADCAALFEEFGLNVNQQIKSNLPRNASRRSSFSYFQYSSYIII